MPVVTPTLYSTRQGGKEVRVDRASKEQGETVSHLPNVKIVSIFKVCKYWCPCEHVARVPAPLRVLERTLTRERRWSLLKTVWGRKIKDGVRKETYETISFMDMVAKVQIKYKQWNAVVYKKTMHSVHVGSIPIMQTHLILEKSVSFITFTD